MAFWGVEVNAGVPLRVKSGKDNSVKLSQATLSEVKDKGNESIHLFLNVNDQKFVIGTLIPHKISQICYDMFLDRDFELSHDWKNGSIYFCGYRHTSSDESDDDTDSDFGELPVITKDNGEPEPTEEKLFLTTEKAASKSKVTIVEPKKGDNTNEDSDEDSDEDFDEYFDEDSDEDDESESQEEKPNLISEKVAAKSKVTIVKPKKGDITNQGDDEDYDEDSDDEDSDERKSQETLMYVSGKDSSGEEDGSSNEDDTDSDEQDVSSEEGDEDTPKKGKKRPVESSTKTLVPEKKTKFSTTQKTDMKKAGEHIATPHPSKKAGKTLANNDKSKQQTPKSVDQVACKLCRKTFNSDSGLQSHTKAKHCDGK